MTKKEKKEQELQRLIDAVAESYLTGPLDDVYEDSEKEGLEPKEVAEKTRTILLDAVKEHRLEKLRGARSEYEEAASRLEKRKYDLPETPAERRELLETIVAARPSLRQPLTLQYRDLTELSDEDVESSLRQLAELGLLPKEQDSGNDKE